QPTAACAPAFAGWSWWEPLRSGRGLRPRVCAPSPIHPCPLRRRRLPASAMSDSTPPEAAPPRWAAPSLISLIFLNQLGFGIVVPLLPFYAKSFNAPAWLVALIFSAFSIGTFFGEPFWGRLSDKYGRKPLLISTICGNCVCYFALAFAPTAWMALLIRLCGGLSSGN